MKRDLDAANLWPALEQGCGKQTPSDFRFKNVFGRRIRPKSALCSCILFASTEIMHRPRSEFPVHFDIKNIYQIRAGKQNASARRLLPATLFEQWPQVCRVKITFQLLPNNWFVSTRTSLIKGFVNWILANSHVRSNKIQPCLNFSAFSLIIICTHRRKSSQTNTNLVQSDS